MEVLSSAGCSTVFISGVVGVVGVAAPLGFCHACMPRRKRTRRAPTTNHVVFLLFSVDIKV